MILVGPRGERKCPFHQKAGGDFTFLVLNSRRVGVREGW